MKFNDMLKPQLTFQYPCPWSCILVGCKRQEEDIIKQHNFIKACVEKKNTLSLPSPRVNSVVSVTGKEQTIGL